MWWCVWWDGMWWCEVGWDVVGCLVGRGLLSDPIVRTLGIAGLDCARGHAGKLALTAGIVLLDVLPAVPQPLRPVTVP